MNESMPLVDALGAALAVADHWSEVLAESMVRYNPTYGLRAISMLRRSMGIIDELIARIDRTNASLLFAAEVHRQEMLECALPLLSIARQVFPEAEAVANRRWTQDPRASRACWSTNQRGAS